MATSSDTDGSDSNDLSDHLVRNVSGTVLLFAGAVVFAAASTFVSGRESALLIAGAVFLAMRPVLNLGYLVWGYLES